MSVWDISDRYRVCLIRQAVGYGCSSSLAGIAIRMRLPNTAWRPRFKHTVCSAVAAVTAHCVDVKACICLSCEIILCDILLKSCIPYGARH